MTVTNPVPPLSVNRRGASLIARFMRTHPMPTVVSVVGAVSFAGAAVGATVVAGRVTDQLIGPAFDTSVAGEGVAGNDVVIGFALIVGFGLLKGVSVVIRRYFAAMLEARMQATLRREVVDRYLGVPLSFFQSRPTGELLAHADADVSGTTMLIKPLPFSLGLIALVVFSLGSLVAVDWTFTAVALALFPCLTVLNRFYTRRVEVPSAEVQRLLGGVSAVAHESFDGALVVKTLGLEAVEARRFGDAADLLRRERLGVGRLRASFEPVLDMLPNLGVIALFLVGAWRIDAGAVTEGDLVQATLLFSILAFPMRVFGFFLEELPRAVVSIERVDEVLAQPVVTTGGSRAVPDGPLGLDVDDLWFAYPRAADTDVPAQPVLRGVSFSVAPGETVAIVGSTGVGKSTLNQLLVRLIEPSRGRILLGGVDIAELSHADLRSAVALVFQESFLFASSVRDNVVLDGATIDLAHVPSDPDGVPDDDPWIAEVADIARVARFLPRLPDGWGTVLGERGVTLSGGQRQRVALARALARRPRLLLLDDATSAVDPTVEAQILDGLRAHEATLLIVAHRLSTIGLADRVVYLDDGVVVGSGTHEDLLAIPGYAALVHAYEIAEPETIT